METVNFQCGACGNLMGVPADCLGGQVRCPHCGQVVLAPAPGPSPPGPEAPSPSSESPAPPEQPLPSFTPADHEDIFTPPPAPGDDLFAEPAPSLELTPAPAPQPQAPAPQPADTEAFPAPAEGAASVAATAQTPPESPPAEAAPPESFSSLTAPDGPPSWMDTAAGPAPAAEQAPGQGPGEGVGVGTVTAQRAARRPTRGGWFIPLVFIPLCLYAVLATVAAVLLYQRQREMPPSPFDLLPDEGDTPGVRKTRKSTRLPYDRRLATAPLPGHLRVGLGGALRVGDLEVRPERVERKRVRVYTEGSPRPEKCAYDSLVLRLSLRNLSDEYAFTPLDNFFDRKWREGHKGRDTLPPLTALEVGSTFFFGGPASWAARGRDDRDAGRREWVEGRKDYDPEGLRPGGTTQTLVCTDGDDPEVQQTLFGVNPEGERVGAPYRGPLLWRVHLRRGPVLRRGKVVSATAVVGVEFTDADIRPRS